MSCLLVLKEPGKARSRGLRGYAPSWAAPPIGGLTQSTTKGCRSMHLRRRGVPFDTFGTLHLRRQTARSIFATETRSGAAVTRSLTTDASWTPGCIAALTLDYRNVAPLAVDPRGLEPLTSWLPAMRSTS